MALANDDLLIVQRHMESYKVTAGNLKDYVNAGDTQGTVTEISQGPGITLSPNPITSTGSVQVYLQANGGLLFNNNAIYVVTDNDTIHKGAGGVLHVKRAPFANEADHAKLADRATVADTTVGNANSADYSNRVNVTESDSTGPFGLTFTTPGNSVTGKTIYMDSNDLNFNAGSNVLFSRGGFNGRLHGNADTATTATNANKIYVSATNTANANYHLYFGSAGTAYRDVRSDSNLYYNPSNNTLYTSNFSGSLKGTADFASSYQINYNNNSNGSYQMLWGSGNIAYGTSGISCNPYANSVTATTMYTSSWFRSTGASGWYSESYGGGIWMQDSTWVRVYGRKRFYVENQIAATGDVTAFYSDSRLKINLGNISDALSKVCSLNGFKYKNNDIAKSFGYNSDEEYVGVSAQEVKEVLPQAVTLAPFDMGINDKTGEVSSKSGEDYLTVKYEKMIPLLIEAIKEQQEQIEELKKAIR